MVLVEAAGFSSAAFCAELGGQVRLLELEELRKRKMRRLCDEELLKL